MQDRLVLRACRYVLRLRENRSILVRGRGNPLGKERLVSGKGLGEEMMVSGEGENFGLAENLTDLPAAVAGGAAVGHVQGLLWSDATGVDVVSVTVHGARVAVPIVAVKWRHAKIVDLGITATEAFGAPRVRDLEATGGLGAVEAVSRYFSMPLSGPPPGPWTGPLPPWWEEPNQDDDQPGDSPKPVVG